MPRKSRIRIKGNDRALMMLCRDARRRWMQYGESRLLAKNKRFCDLCGVEAVTEWDHKIPLGARPRIPHAFGEWLEKMFYGECQALCKVCHLAKTKRERERRKNGQSK